MEEKKEWPKKDYENVHCAHRKILDIVIVGVPGKKDAAPTEVDYIDVVTDIGSIRHYAKLSGIKTSKAGNYDITVPTSDKVAVANINIQYPFFDKLYSTVKKAKGQGIDAVMTYTKTITTYENGDKKISYSFGYFRSEDFFSHIATKCIDPKNDNLAYLEIEKEKMEKRKAAKIIEPPVNHDAIEEKDAAFNDAEPEDTSSM